MSKFLIMIAAVLCLHACSINDEDDGDNTIVSVPIGTEAPDFTMVTSDFPDGVRLSSFRGKFVVLEFWASWCPDCQAATPAMLTLYESCKADDVSFIGVSFDTEQEAWQSYITENMMNWTQYSELKPWKETYVNSLYNVRWIPALMLIDKAGIVVFTTDDPAKMQTELLNLKEQ